MNGRLLEPGIHLCEIAVDGLLETEEMEEALTMMGFEDVFFDATPTKGDRRGEGTTWGSPWLSGQPRETVTHCWRFVAKTRLALRAENVPRVRWLFQHRMLVDPSVPERSGEGAFPLVRGKTYDLFFAAWLKTSGERRAVVDALGKMNGFRVRKTACMKMLMRFPDRPGADGALWYALAEWEGPDSVVVDQDPFFFYQVKEAAGGGT